MQAVELYILIVFILISSFYGYVPAKPPADLRLKAPIENRPGEKTDPALDVDTFKAASNPVPMSLATPAPAPALAIDTSYRNHPYKDNRLPIPTRSSATSRLSSWIISRRMSSRHSVGSSDRTQLWNQDEAERGESPVDLSTAYDKGQNSNSSSPLAMRSQENQQRINAITATMVNDASSRQGQVSEFRWTTSTGTAPSRENSANDANAPRRDGSLDSDIIVLQPPRMQLQELSGAETPSSIGSYYGNKEDIRPNKPNTNGLPTIAVRNTDSPIYGLNGIMQRTNPGRMTPESVARTRSSALSFNELIRQQTELDNSIAALRLLSPQQDEYDPGSVPASPIVSRDASRSISRSMSSNGLPSSVRSIFSLQDFPEPPATFASTSNGIPPIPPSSSSLKARADRSDQRRSRFTINVEPPSLPVPKIPAIYDYPSTPQSMPVTPGRDSGETISPRLRTKVNSAGTQYDVTSFIGSRFNASNTCLIVLIMAIIPFQT